MKTQPYICAAVRTPIGRFGGMLATVRPDDMAATVIAALMAREPNLDPSAVEDVFLGCANQAGEDNRNVARMSALLAGLPVAVPGVTVNRLCASGAEAVAAATRAIASGDIDLAIAGGVESMTRAPFVMAKSTAPWSRRATIEDTTIGWRFVNPRLHALHGTDSMPETAEHVARAEAISREAQDAFALRSQQLTEQARRAGYHGEEIVPVSVGKGASEVLVEHDEHPRPQTDAATLATLPPIVNATGTVTAGNAAGINDGAAAMLITSEATAAGLGLRPRARVLGAAVAGVEPSLMGLGPVPACRKLFARLGLGIDDFDLIEINEAFAAQVVASLRLLGVDPLDERVNAHGGAIALGHPLGMSGARLVMTAVHGLEHRGGRRALVTMCVGVGQGMAIALERV